jgi:AcrR family transcriptional regulator
MTNPPPPAPARSEAKRTRIVETAMRHFAERGYHAARIEDMAAELGIAKGSVFQYFGSKEGLFLAAYKRAVGMLPRYQDAPADVRGRGFFATLRYWLERTDHLVREDWIPYRLTLIGNYGTDLSLRRDINRFLVSEDAYGTAAFVQQGLEQGELRRDVEIEMLISVLDWTMERFQDALLTEELFPGFVRRHDAAPGRTQRRVEQFLAVLRSGIGAAAPACAGSPSAVGTRRGRARGRARGRS